MPFSQGSLLCSVESPETVAMVPDALVTLAGQSNARGRRDLYIFDLKRENEEKSGENM